MLSFIMVLYLYDYGSVREKMYTLRMKNDLKQREKLLKKAPNCVLLLNVGLRWRGEVTA